MTSRTQPGRRQTRMARRAVGTGRPRAAAGRRPGKENTMANRLTGSVTGRRTTPLICTLARVVGATFLLVGVLGFIPGITRTTTT